MLLLLSFAIADGPIYQVIIYTTQPHRSIVPNFLTAEHGLPLKKTKKTTPCEMGASVTPLLTYFNGPTIFFHLNFYSSLTIIPFDPKCLTIISGDLKPTQPFHWPYSCQNTT
jgi:hypothetical protein